jgi:hypothetical protein
MEMLDKGTRRTDVEKGGVFELELGRGWIRQADPDHLAPLGDARE